KHHQ
ncbi:his Kinase A domain protein, partial [Vibrio parahaemolyticus V-223/04]